MNDKKPLMDYRRVQKLQTPLLLTGALLSGVGTSVSVPLVILGIAIMLFAIVIWVLYYRCPHCGRPLGRIGEGGAYCPHCGKEIRRQTVDQIIDQILALPEGTRIQVMAPGVRGR